MVGSRRGVNRSTPSASGERRIASGFIDAEMNRDPARHIMAELRSGGHGRYGQGQEPGLQRACGAAQARAGDRHGFPSFWPESRRRFHSGGA